MLSLIQCHMPTILTFVSIQTSIFWTHLSGDASIPFSFRGNIKDGKLDGPGKLKLGPGIMMDDYRTCLKVYKLLGLDPIEVIGTFVNGVLHGNAKFVLADGKVIIANLVNGLADGLWREWDENGNLMSVSFSYGGTKMGKSWELIGKNLVFSDVATLKRSDDLTVVIPFMNGPKNEEILAGKFWNHIFVLHEVQRVKTLTYSAESESCILKLLIETEGQILTSFYDVLWDKFINKLPDHRNAKHCRDFDLMDGRTPQKLEKWYQETNFGVPNRMYHQTVLKMRQETEVPSSGPQLISDISLDIRHPSDDTPLSQPGIFVTFFEKQRSKVSVQLASFDDQLQLHGAVKLQVIKLAYTEHNFGFDFNKVVTFSGVFNHGIVEGPVQLLLQVIRSYNYQTHGALIIKSTASYLCCRTELSRFLWMPSTDKSFDLYDSVKTML